MLSVLLLARWAGLADGPGGQVPLDVAPLFESVDALEEAGDIIARLLADPVYRAHLAARGNRQVVMIGYSDSNKSAGIVASRWLLRRAQEAMVAACDAAGVQLRGLPRPRRLDQSRRRPDRRPRAQHAAGRRCAARSAITEQGESVNERYGLRPIALRSFEQTRERGDARDRGLLRRRSSWTRAGAMR